MKKPVPHRRDVTTLMTTGTASIQSAPIFFDTDRLELDPAWEETKMQVQQNMTSSWNSADSHPSDKNKNVLPRGRPDEAQFRSPWVGDAGEGLERSGRGIEIWRRWRLEFAYTGSAVLSMPAHTRKGCNCHQRIGGLRNRLESQASMPSLPTKAGPCNLPRL
jgi:hypothetical protein